MNAMPEIVPDRAVAPSPELIGGDRDEGRRWAGAFALVLGLHAVPALVAAYWLPSVPAYTPAEPAVLIDMAPLAAPPEPPSERPPGPQQVKAETPIPREVREVVKTPDVPNAAVSIPITPPEPPREVARIPIPETTAPPTRPAPPAQRASSGLPTWQGLVLGRLNQFKRYPSEAQARRQQGVPWIRFVMDRDGKVLSVRLERGSGYASLDREALALPRRAEPLPAPPDEVSGSAIELVVPVEFFLR